MKRSLLIKFILGYLIFGVLAFCLIATVSHHVFYNNLLENEAADLRSLAKSLSQKCAALYDNDEFSSSAFISRVSFFSEETGYKVWILDQDCQVIYDSDGQLEGCSLDEFNPLSTEIYLTDYYPQLGEGYISTFYPISANMEMKGYVILHEATTGISELASSQLVPMYIVAAIIYGLSFIILGIAYFMVIKPVRDITVAADQYSQGNFKHQIKSNHRDELGYLAGTLDYMARDIDAAEESQRKLISDISHDFRSPLTSIKGYLEAMRDGVIPPEMQAHYMDVVISEADRLTNLTQSMLSLNSVSGGKLLLNYSDFDINEVIKKTCASFEGQCQKKEIDFDLYFYDETTLVHADLQKIQQVLYNLIDNAIKFSPVGATITIDVSERGDKVFISIKDQGIGISKENIKKIWNRFYKTDESRGKDKKGTGLGLSIVREIITAHEETIDVVSTEGAGTQFTFRLKKG